MKICIIGGAGTLGATTAFLIAQQNLADEICLIDIKENVAKSHEMDMGQAAVSFAKTQITSGGFNRLEGADIVIITAGIPETQVSSRMAFLEGNLKVLFPISQQVNLWAPDAWIINVTNPVDVMNAMMNVWFPMKRNKLIGFSMNDSYRFRWAISKVLMVHYEEVAGYVIGEHGEEQCPLYSSVKIRGEFVRLTEDQKDQINHMIRNWFLSYQSLNAGRTSGWLSSLNLTHTVRLIIDATEEINPCSAIDETGVSVGRLVKFTSEGLREVQMEITEDEHEQWLKAKEKMRMALESLKLSSSESF